MATVTVSLDDLYNQFKARAELEAKVAELQSKLTAVQIAPKKVKKEKDPNAPEKPKVKKPGKYATPEELAEARKENGKRLAASNKARKEAAQQIWLAEQLEAKKSESGESSSASESGTEAVSDQQETDNEN